MIAARGRQMALPSGVSSFAAIWGQESFMVLGFLPSASRPVWRASLVTATYSSPSQCVVKLASLAYPASNKILLIGSPMLLPRGQPGPRLPPPGQRARGTGQRPRPAARAAIKAVVTGQGVLRGLLGPGLLHPGVHPRGDQRLQLPDAQAQLRQPDIRRRRRARPDLRPVPRGHVHADH